MIRTKTIGTMLAMLVALVPMGLRAQEIGDTDAHGTGERYCHPKKSKDRCQPKKKGFLRKLKEQVRSGEITRQEARERLRKHVECMPPEKRREFLSTLRERRDRQEDRRDRREDCRDRKEDIRDRQEDRVDRRHDGGKRDRWRTWDRRGLPRLRGGPGTSEKTGAKMQGWPQRQEHESTTAGCGSK